MCPIQFVPLLIILPSFAGFFAHWTWIRGFHMNVKVNIIKYNEYLILLLTVMIMNYTDVFDDFHIELFKSEIIA